MTDSEARWGTIEEKDHKGNIINTKEGLVIGRGENKRVISPADVENLAKSWAPFRELASYFGVREQTFRDHFRESVEKGRTQTKIALRHKQIEVAMSGNTVMLIWLGKNILGQADQPLTSEANQVLPWTTPDAEQTDEVIRSDK